MQHTIDELRQKQSLPLQAKIYMTQSRIRSWYDHYDGQVYVSFSGGKDSTVLLDIARKIYPDIEAVFINTDLEYPEIQSFVKTFENVTILRPKMRFDEVIKKYGYPIISKEVSQKIYDYRENPNGYAKNKFELGKYGEKYNLEKWKPLRDSKLPISNQCCNVLKKKPAKLFSRISGKQPITAQMASESHLREFQWLKKGCNGFGMKRPISNPMSFWTEQDVYQYIKQNNLPIASVYGDIVYKNNPEQIRMDIDCGTEKLCTTGYDRTGCIFCGFGAHLEKSPSRFERLKITHPKQYAYCMNGGEYVDGVWQPNKDGLGMRHVFEELNKIYGDGFIKY